MVHALKEAWRVVKPAGVIIDLRPISIDTPLLILTASGWESAGLPDQGPDRVHDNASNGSIRKLVKARLFLKLRQRYFDVSHYWNNLEELEMDIEERWKDDVIISSEIWQRARLLCKTGKAEKRVRFPFRKKITLYQKV
jgi:hypothetical protein